MGYDEAINNFGYGYRTASLGSMLEVRTKNVSSG